MAAMFYFKLSNTLLRTFFQYVKLREKQKASFCNVVTPLSS